MFYYPQVQCIIYVLLHVSYMFHFQRVQCIMYIQFHVSYMVYYPRVQYTNVLLPASSMYHIYYMYHTHSTTREFNVSCMFYYPKINIYHICSTTCIIYVLLPASSMHHICSTTASLMSLMASLVTTSRMQQCFNVPIDSNHEFLLLFYCCVLLEIKLTTTKHRYTTRSNLSRYCTQHCVYSSKAWIRLETHNIHPIFAHHGRAMGVWFEDTLEYWPRCNGTALLYVSYIFYYPRVQCIIYVLIYVLLWSLQWSYYITVTS